MTSRKTLDTQNPRNRKYCHMKENTVRLIQTRGSKSSAHFQVQCLSYRVNVLSLETQMKTQCWQGLDDKRPMSGTRPQLLSAVPGVNLGFICA